MGDQSFTEGIDLSRWNPEWQPEISISRGIKYVASRLSVGNYYIDETFKVNFAKARRYNLPFAGYHVVSPLFSATDQMNFVFKYLKDYSIDRLVLDVEVHKNQSQAKITDVVYGCVQESLNAGYSPIIYTRANWWNSFVLRRAYWKELDLWVANYGVLSPAIPIDWKTVGWKLWQYSADGNFLGNYYGVASNHIDLNRFKGTVQEMYAFFNKTAPTPDPDPDPEPEPEPKQDYVNAYLWRTTTNLNIRTKPTTSSSVVRTLPANAIVEELERVSTGSDLWARIGNQQYCAIEYRGTNYLTPIFKESKDV